VGFLPLAQLIIDALPMMNSAVLMALMDQWHLETHMFHLPCGETIVTLQDVTMILSLPTDGTPVCGPVSLDRWKDFIEDAFGIRPPNIAAD
jgi:hypothetical protein